MKKVSRQLLLGFACELVAIVRTAALLSDIFCKRPLEGGRSVTDQDKTQRERVTLKTLQEDGKLPYMCQGWT